MKSRKRNISVECNHSFFSAFLLLLLALFLSGYRGEYIWFSLWTCTLGMYLLNRVSRVHILHSIIWRIHIIIIIIARSSGRFHMNPFLIFDPGLFDWPKKSVGI